jgi:hypothetical protein
MAKRRETADERRARTAIEYRAQREFEEQQRRLAVIAEFGGRKREPMLVLEDDPINDELVCRLVDEVLRLRSQLWRVGWAAELAQAGKLAAVVQYGPCGQSSEESTDVEMPAPAAAVLEGGKSAA